MTGEQNRLRGKQRETSGNGPKVGTENLEDGLKSPEETQTQIYLSLLGVFSLFVFVSFFLFFVFWGENESLELYVMAQE